MIRAATCHCETLKLECSGEPSKVSLCNCFDCQRRTGSQFSVAAFFPREAVCLSEGHANSFRRQSASGQPVTFHFCAGCGSTLWWDAERLPHLVGVAVGAFTDPDFAMPAQAVWTADKHHWLTFPEAMPLHVGNPQPGVQPEIPAPPVQAGKGNRQRREDILILPYEPRHFDGVDALWRECFPDEPPWNSADVAISQKMQFQPELFFVAEAGDAVAGTAMAGYDGHRGWLYAVAVQPAKQRARDRLFAACRG